VIKFGTDGWRAVINEEFTFENVEKLTQAVADYLIEHTSTGQVPTRQHSLEEPVPTACPVLVIGYDTRLLSDKFAERCAEVMAANGIKVLLSQGPCSTPILSFTIKDRKLAGGIMITASHNPPQFNGFKYKAQYAGPAEVELTDRFEGLLGKNPVKAMPFEDAKAKGLIEVADLSGEWIKFIKGYIDFGLIKKAKYSIAVDSMYGASGGFVAPFLESMGIKVTALHADRDPSFGGVAPEPIERNLKELIALMKKGGFNLGIALDGDVDRVGIVRSDGAYVNAHQVLSHILLHMVEDKKWTGSVVKTVALTFLIDKIAKKHNLKLHETPVGFKHICKLMREEDVLIGGEESGGFGFKNYVPERDGILAGLLILEMMAYRKKDLIRIMDETEKEYGRFCYKREDCEYPDEKKKTLFGNLKANPPAKLAGVNVRDINTKDGAKFICEDGSWLLYRLSGTEPILRIYVEAPSDAKVAAIMKEARQLAGINE
jgi:alpha-D-glucose phosphate-specific phosphoglucomutase